MKTIKTLIILFIIIVTFTSCVEEKNKIEIIDDETFFADEDNEKLKDIFDKAQDSLQYFIFQLKSHSKDTNYWFSAKTKLNGNDGIHHIWFNTIEYKKNGTFVGIFHNEIDWSNKYKIGDTIYVDKNKIEDWYIENEISKKIEGDFTEKILFNNYE